MRRGRQDAARQRRGGDQRGDPAAAVRGHRDARLRRKSVAREYRRLVLRAPASTAAGMDRRRYVDDGGEGPASFCAAGSRRAIRSTRRRSRCFSGNGGRCQQFQQTRGTLAMLAQWISLAAREQFEKARREPLITLGSAPLDSARVPQPWCSASSAKRGSTPRSSPTSPASRAMPAPSMPTSRARCGTSTAGSAPRSCSSPRAARSTRWHTCPNCASRSASAGSRHGLDRHRRRQAGGGELLHPQDRDRRFSHSPQGDHREGGQRPARFARRRDRRASLRSAGWSRPNSNAAPAFRWSRCGRIETLSAMRPVWFSSLSTPVASGERATPLPSGSGTGPASVDARPASIRHP